MEEDQNGTISFQKRIQKLKKTCEQLFSELVLLGYDKEKSKFRCKISKKGQAVHALFSKDIMKIITDVTNHGDVKMILDIFKKKNPGKSAGNLIVNQKEVVAIGDEGPSLLIYLIQRVYKKIKNSLMSQDRKNLRRLKKDIKASFSKIDALDSISVKTRITKDLARNQIIISAEIKTKKNGKAYSDLQNKAKFCIPDKICFAGPRIEKIISDINGYTSEILKLQNNDSIKKDAE